MRKFRPRSQRPGRLWPWLLIWLFLVIAYLIWMGSAKMSTTGATLAHAVTRSTADVSVTRSSWTWHGKPVYALYNRGYSLDHVNVYNWAEDQLPILYVGQTLPANYTTKTPLASPPYNLSRHASMWFVSSSTSPATFTVTWDAKGSVHYTTVSADGMSPRQGASSSPPPQTAAYSPAFTTPPYGRPVDAVFHWQPIAFVVH
jgi:hypothetical protein